MLLVVCIWSYTVGMYVTIFMRLVDYQQHLQYLVISTMLVQHIQQHPYFGLLF